jgi:error-prone DNA polymerase
MIMDRFGVERTATLAMPETYRVLHAVRDVGAALGMDPDVTDRLARAFPHPRARPRPRSPSCRRCATPPSRSTAG